MIRALVVIVLASSLGGCSSEPSAPPRLAESPSDPVAPAEESDAERETFGAELDQQLPLTPLAAILADPSSYRGRVVRTEGEVARVCQRMGCWMELREGDEGPAVRVPMAGHNFFLPRDCAGRRAEMQGRVTLSELSPSVREHLESEGAVETRSALSIEATGVVLN